MMHRIILKGADDDIFMMLSMMHDDMVSKILKAKFTAEEALSKKNKDAAVKELGKLLDTRVLEEKDEDGKLTGKIIIAEEGGIKLRNFIKEKKPLFNRELFSREYIGDKPVPEEDDEEDDKKEKLASVQQQRTEFLTKYKTLDKFKEAFAKIKTFNETFIDKKKGTYKDKYFDDKVIQVPEDYDMSKIENQIKRLDNKYGKEIERIGIKLGGAYPSVRESTTPEMEKEFDKASKDYQEGIKKITDKIDKLKNKTKNTTIQILNADFKEDVKNHRQKIKSFAPFIKDGKPIEGLAKLIKDAPSKLKEIKAADKKVARQLESSDSLLNHLNRTTKTKRVTLSRFKNENNFDVFMSDLRRVLAMILNSFGTDYKRQVNQIIQKINDSLKNEMARLKDRKSDDAIRALDEKEELAGVLNTFYKDLNRMLRELSSKSEIVKFFTDNPISKQTLIRLIQESGEDEEYLNYTVPRKDQADKLQKLPRPIDPPSQIDQIKSKLTKQNISKIVKVLVEARISPSGFYSDKQVSAIKTNVEKYTRELTDIAVQIENSINRTEKEIKGDSNQFKRSISKIKTATEAIDLGSLDNIKAKEFSDALNEINNEYQEFVDSFEFSKLESLARKVRERMATSSPKSEKEKPKEDEDKEEVQEEVQGIEFSEYVKESELKQQLKEAKENIKQLSQQIKKLISAKNKLEEKEEKLAESSEMQSQVMSDDFKQFFDSISEETRNLEELEEDFINHLKQIAKIEAVLENKTYIKALAISSYRYGKNLETEEISRLKDAIKTTRNIMRRREIR